MSALTLKLNLQTERVDKDKGEGHRFCKHMCPCEPLPPAGDGVEVPLVRAWAAPPKPGPAAQSSVQMEVPQRPSMQHSMQLNMHSAAAQHASAACLWFAAAEVGFVIGVVTPVVRLRVPAFVVAPVLSLVPSLALVASLLASRLIAASDRAPATTRLLIIGFVISGFVISGFVIIAPLSDWGPVMVPVLNSLKAGEQQHQRRQGCWHTVDGCSIAALSDPSSGKSIASAHNEKSCLSWLVLTGFWVQGIVPLPPPSSGRMSVVPKLFLTMAGRRGGEMGDSSKTSSCRQYSRRSRASQQLSIASMNRMPALGRCKQCSRNGSELAPSTMWPSCSLHASLPLP